MIVIKKILAGLSSSYLQFVCHRWLDYSTWMSSCSRQIPSPSDQRQAQAGCIWDGSSYLVPSCTGFECKSSQSLDKAVQNPERNERHFHWLHSDLAAGCNRVGEQQEQEKGLLEFWSCRSHYKPYKHENKQKKSMAILNVLERFLFLIKMQATS